MIVYNKQGKEMVHPDVVKDMMNDSMHSAIEYKNYVLEYDERRAMQIEVDYEVIKP